MVIRIWTGQRSQRVVSSMALVLRPECRNHEQMQHPCWRVMSNSLQTRPADDPIFGLAGRLHFSPRIITDTDLKHSCAKACYVLVSGNASTSPAASFENGGKFKLAAHTVMDWVHQGETIGPLEARALRQIFPTKPLWYTHGVDGDLVEPSELRCSVCSKQCGLKYCRPWSKQGLGARCLFEAMVPTVCCKDIKCRMHGMSPVDAGFARLLPPACVPTFSWDRFHDRVYEHAATDSFCYVDAIATWTELLD